MLNLASNYPKDKGRDGTDSGCVVDGNPYEGELWCRPMWGWKGRAGGGVASGVL